MKITIHRGTNEIGGSCVEIADDKTRILIDIGEQLEPIDNIRRPRSTPSILPSSLVESLKASPPISAILISHAHRDHFGLLPLLPASIPVYMTKGCEVMLDIAQYFDQVSSIHQPIKTIEIRIPLNIGEIVIYPFLADHSAMDACSFLIMVDEKRIFYSGDIRAHGRKKVLFEDLVTTPPPRIDYLILEGTLLNRKTVIKTDENYLEVEMTSLFQGENELFLINFSSQNFDRLVTVFRACLRSGRTLVIDPYTAAILESVHKIHDTIPNWNWNNIKIYFAQNKHTTKLAENDHLFAFKGGKISLAEIQHDRKKYVIKLNYRIREKLKSEGMLTEAHLIWSQWDEYFKNEKPFWDQQNISPVYIHTSGHAYPDDLLRLVTSMKPGCILPIHTTQKSEYTKVFSPFPVKVLQDGEVLDI